ncbi:MAG: lipid-binding SYLF domain-containing protein [Candidatus Polarisedimenticolia bacterium]
MRILRVVALILLAGVIGMPAVADLESDNEKEKLQKSQQVLTASVTAPDKGIPKDLLEKAECIGVFPDVKKAAFVVGGEWGRGVFTCRQKDGTMGAPAFFTMGGPSVGWQIGAEEADLILLIMNQEGVKKLLQDKFTIGVEGSAAAGPVGRTAQAGTDLQLHAQILSWSRSRGLFAGASLEGIVMKPNNKATEDFYGKPLDAKSILVDQSVPVPQGAKSFVATANQHAKRSS